jgi:hypothetical protein
LREQEKKQRELKKATSKEKDEAERGAAAAVNQCSLFLSLSLSSSFHSSLCPSSK